MAFGTTAAILGSAAIGAGASLIGANRNAKAAKSAAEVEAAAAQQAADAQAQAQREALAAQREYQSYLDDTLRPEINAGADYEAALRALTFGEGSPASYRLPTRAMDAGGGYTVASGGYAAPIANPEQLYLQANPDVADWATRTQQAVGGDVNELAARHYAQYGVNEGRLSPDQLAAQAVAQASAQQAGVAAQQMAPAGPATVTRADVMSQIAQNPLALAGQAEAAAIDRIAEQQFNEGAAAAGDFRNAEIARIDKSDTESLGVLNAYLAGERQRLDAERQRREAANAAEQDQLTSYLTGRRGAVGAEEARRRRELDEGRDIQLGNLTNYITAWDRGAQVARGRAEDQMFSRGGVTGRIGQTQRGVAQVNEDYARDRATTEAQGVSSIWDRYITQRPQIGEFAYNELADLDGMGYATGRGLRNERGQIGEFAYNTGAGLNDRGYQTGQALADRRFDRTGDAVSGYYADMGRNRDNRTELGLRSATRRADAADRAYSDYSGMLRDGANRRNDLLSQLTNTYRDTANQQSQAAINTGNAQAQGYLNAASARAGGQLAAADARNRGYTDAAKAVGDYWANRNRKRTSTGAFGETYPRSF